jgi:hypothetical protein
VAQQPYPAANKNILKALLFGLNFAGSKNSAFKNAPKLSP